MPIYHVSQVTSYLREMLENDYFLNDVWVQGEVANLAHPGSGNCYYTLRDSRSSIRCAMFAGKSYGAELLSNGAAVIAHGRVGVYEQRGEVQLIVDQVRPEGMGEHELRLAELRSRLEREGLFDVSRKRKVPQFPRRVGVVTSPTGSVWHDIRTVVERRYPLTELVLAPAAVQGAHAASTVRDALSSLDAAGNVDVVILARGGGSLEDLLPFNDEGVARAVFASRAPVISAVGHETDHTIVDLTADLRAPTPSAAAEMAVPDVRELSAGIGSYRQRMASRLAGRLDSAQGAVTHLRARCIRGRPDVDALRQRVDRLLDGAYGRLRRDMGVRAERAGALEMRLKSLSPSDTLRRGYAIVRAPGTGEILGDASTLAAADRVHVTLARGAFDAEVLGVHPDGAGDQAGGAGPSR